MNLPTSWPIMSDPCNTTFLLSLSADTPFLPGNFCSLVSQGLCRSDIANTTPLVVHPPPLKAEVWGYGFLSVLIVSLSSVVGAIFLPLMKQESFGKILIGMIGLAVGCLSGGAIFHLIPQAFQLHGDTDEELEGYLYKALVIVAAIFAFFLIERVMKLWMNWKDHRVIADGMALSSSYRRGSRYSPKLDSKFNHPSVFSVADHGQAPGHEHVHSLDRYVVMNQPIKAVAWMVIAGDGIHNFVDGLSMGAAFSLSIIRGISISVAVLCEELPHELGDLAILISSGMSVKKALFYNFLSALSCFAGLVVGILLGELEEAAPWIFAVAGGMFLYISLVDMLPEMTVAMEEASEAGLAAGANMLGIQSAGLLSGFAIMFLLARYGGNIDL